MTSDLWCYYCNCSGALQTSLIGRSVCVLSHVQLFGTPWTVACQAPLSVGSPGSNTGVGCCARLQGIFPTQGSDTSLVSCTGSLVLLLLALPGKPSDCPLTSKFSISPPRGERICLLIPWNNNIERKPINNPTRPLSVRLKGRVTCLTLNQKLGTVNRRKSGRKPR